jgi:NADH dehydrogenase
MLARMQAMTFELAPGEPVLTRDNLDSMKVDNVLTRPLAPELGLEPASLETIAPVYLSGASSRSRFDAFRASAGR